MKIFIVEDNTNHLNLLKAKVISLGYMVVGTCQTAACVLPEIKKTTPDIVLMDINLDADNDGIEIAKKIKEISDAAILFITSQNKSKTISDAISIEPSGYLVKPVDPIELKANIELAALKKNNAKASLPQVKLENEFLTVRTGEKLQLVQFKNIKLLKVEIKNYVTLVDENDRQYVVRDSLKNLLNSVLPRTFIRTHHSYGVNLDFILFIDEKEQMVHLKTNDAVPIGKSFKKNVYEKMNIKS